MKTGIVSLLHPTKRRDFHHFLLCVQDRKWKAISPIGTAREKKNINVNKTACIDQHLAMTFAYSYMQPWPY